ncbi:PJA1 isoform 7, partial [Pan troglodytes]
DPVPAARCSASRADFLPQSSVASQSSSEGKLATKGDSSERERREQNLPARALLKLTMEIKPISQLA